MDNTQFFTLFILISAIYFRIVAIYRAVQLDDDSAEVLSVLSIVIFAVAFGLLVFSMIYPG